MKKSLILLATVTLVNCTKEKFFTLEKIVKQEILVTNEYYLITIAGEGSKITKSAASGSSVTLSASAYVGYEFEAWSSGSTDNPLTLNIGSDQTITANFGKLIELEGVGTLSEQTTKEAIKTIYGKWEFPSSISDRSTCELVSLEFTNQNFFMTLNIGYKSIFHGRFTLGEDASGKVEKIELKYIFDDNSEIVIAVLTNMIVTKTGDDLNATFNIAFAFPINSEEEGICDALSRNIEAKKAEPMAESKNLSADSNHAKFIGTWEMASIIDADDGSDMESFLNEACKDEVTDKMIEGCIPPVKWIVDITPYGTFNTLYISSNGGVMDSDAGTWEWKDSSQKAFSTRDYDDEQRGDEEGEYNTITSISASEMSIQSNGGTYTLKKIQ